MNRERDGDFLCSSACLILTFQLISALYLMVFVCDSLSSSSFRHVMLQYFGFISFITHNSHYRPHSVFNNQMY